MGNLIFELLKESFRNIQHICHVLALDQLVEEYLVQLLTNYPYLTYV